MNSVIILYRVYAKSMSLYIFVAGTLALLYFSWWVSLKDRRYHGIYRFFAFESIFAVILLNHYWWFNNPFSFLQLVSWSSLFLSLFLAVHGFYLLYRFGNPEDKENAETTTRLVMTGTYHYIRHPLYASLVFLCLGAYLKHPGWLVSVLLLITIIAAYLTAKVEEQEMLRKFGNEYTVYMDKTKMFIPWVF